MSAMRNTTIVLWASFVLVGCAHQSVQNENGAGKCDEAYENLDSVKSQELLKSGALQPLVEYVVTPSTYLAGWTLTAITVPSYMAFSLVAVPAHDIIQLSHDLGAYPSYKVTNDNGDWDIEGQGVTANSNGHPDIHFYTFDRGLFPYLDQIAREPLTTRELREDARSYAKPHMNLYYASMLQVGACFAKRDGAGDREKALGILADYESDPSAPEIDRLAFVVQKYYYDLKLLSNPSVMAEEFSIPGSPLEQRDADFYMRGIGNGEVKQAAAKAH